MLGGLLCERRHSEATPAMKPKLSLAVTITRPGSAANGDTHPGSVPLPLLLRMPHQDSPPIVLKQQKPLDGAENEFEEEHSGKCIRIGCGKYEVRDEGGDDLLNTSIPLVLGQTDHIAWTWQLWGKATLVALFQWHPQNPFRWFFVAFVFLNANQLPSNACGVSMYALKSWKQ